MAEKNYQPMIAPPEQEEQPEEGFVPYCGSEEAKAEKPRIYFKILAVLVVVAVAGMLFLFLGKSFNFYHKTLNSLQFDYRSGEAAVEDITLEPGACAIALDQEIGRQQITVEAAVYLFNEEQQLSKAVSEYRYIHNVNEDLLEIRSGSDSWPFTKKTQQQIALRDGAPPINESYRKPLLRELFFGTESHDAYTFECYDTFLSSVGRKSYTCEIWLMSDSSLSATAYYTLYRYYLDGRLAGMRLLNDTDAIMEVYDIRSYTIG